MLLNCKPGGSNHVDSMQSQGSSESHSSFKQPIHKLGFNCCVGNLSPKMVQGRAADTLTPMVVRPRVIYNSNVNSHKYKALLARGKNWKIMNKAKCKVAKGATDHLNNIVTSVSVNAHKVLKSVSTTTSQLAEIIVVITIVLTAMWEIVKCLL